MPSNDGRTPRHTLVDIEYRNGQRRYGIDPKQREWKPLECSPHDWDIARWQPARGDG